MSKKVRMIAQISGTRDGKPWPGPGETISLPADEAAALVRNGQAAELNAPEENALADVAPETAVVPKSGNKAVSAEARVNIKPAPHADEEEAFHNPPVAGEKAAAKAGQKAVDERNKDLEK